MKKINKNICPVMDCEKDIDRAGLCFDHYMIKNMNTKCFRHDCNEKRYYKEKWCHHCHLEVDELYSDLGKATDKCQEIVNIMNKKFNIGYQDEIYLS